MNLGQDDLGKEVVLYSYKVMYFLTEDLFKTQLILLYIDIFSIQVRRHGKILGKILLMNLPGQDLKKGTSLKIIIKNLWR